ncbi:ankyrin repeat domain-containing protein 34B isoform X3 [Onychostoma macrolepis]|uniref:ankyrin repeat domain-containing protein 34B isoform X3 n=1 Tax=Onychostoma macrolepis TaxID=369639 RepID=UPI002729B655|nr:ankyrin repeat domain-containing protein 34B isoform X3 [Onychostoma macrolepis]
MVLGSSRSRCSSCRRISSAKSAVMTESPDYLLDGSPLISAAKLGKLRLVRLLVEGGAQVNERNQRGETPLLAACRALRGDQSGSSMLRLIQYLLQNQADPNIQDKTGRTALMYACMERAGPDVASALTAAGADPSTEDYAGASALVYAINARDQDTLTVLMDACRARGRDIIIIATDLSCDPNVPPSPDSSPVSCMSPSDIELKTNSPNSEGENIFNFRGGGQVSPVLPRSETRCRQRLRSEPWLAIQNLAHLSQSYEKNTEEEENPDDGCSLPSYLKFKSESEQLQSRRNTLPDLLQPPALKLTLSGSDTHLHRDPCASRFPSIYRSSSLLLAPPDGLHELHTANRKKARAHGGFLPPLPGVSVRNVCRDPIPASAPLRREAHGPPRRHSVQLEQITPKESSETLYLL